MLHSCETKPYLKRCTMCFGYRGEIQWPSETTQPLSAASPQTSAGLFVSGLSFVLLRILFQPQQFRSPFKHINQTYMYFNLLLIISAADKKITTTKKYTFLTLSFHVYSVKIIGMWSDRQALITGQLQLTTFAVVLIVPPVKLLVLSFYQTRICFFESHTHGLQSSIVVTNSTGNNSNFFTLISWKDAMQDKGAHFKA